jgi:hypothetical protein
LVAVVEVVAGDRRAVVTVGSARPVVDVVARATPAAAVTVVTGVGAAVVVVLLADPSTVAGEVVVDAASADGRDVGRPAAALEQPPAASPMTSIAVSTVV